MKASKLALVVLTSLNAGPCLAQKTDASLFLKSDGVQVAELASKSGDLYLTAGHHGPAVENPWFGLRMNFDKSCGIDVYSKQRPQLELRKALWYPTEADQKNGWGADCYMESNRTITSVVFIIACASAAEAVPSLDEEFDHPQMEVRPSGYW